MTELQTDARTALVPAAAAPSFNVELDERGLYRFVSRAFPPVDLE